MLRSTAQRLLACGVLVLVCNQAGPTNAQSFGTCKDHAVANCCSGVQYWLGYDSDRQAWLSAESGYTQNPPSDGAGLGALAAFVRYWESTGELDGSRRTRLVTTAVMTLLLFLLVLGVLWFVARKHWSPPGWLQVLMLVAVPGLTWYLVPEWLAGSEAEAKARTFVDGQLYPFCVEHRDNPHAVDAGKPCSPTLWSGLAVSNETGDAYQPTLDCADLPPSDILQPMLSAPGNTTTGHPCYQVCAQAVSLVPPEGEEGLRRGVKLVEDELFAHCEGVAANWRAAAGPSARDWEGCVQGLSARSFSREINRDFALGYGWVGALASAFLTLLAFLVLRRR